MLGGGKKEEGAPLTFLDNINSCGRHIQSVNTINTIRVDAGVARSAGRNQNTGIIIIGTFIHKRK